MQIQLGYYPIVVLLVLARVGAIVAMSPIFEGRVEPQIRIAMTLVITLALLPALPASWVAAAREVDTPLEMALALLNELLLGAALGLMCNLFLGACALAGELMGHGCSLTMAQTLDPLSGESSPAMDQVLRMLFVLLFLLGNGHLALLRLLGASFRSLPPALGWLDGAFGNRLVALSADMFTMGVCLALPLLAAALVVDVCFGLIARLAPEFDVLFLSLPVRLSVGLVLFGLVLRYSAGSFARMIEKMLNQFARVLL
jgi:flagellar biosynthesis protein FliR